MESVSSLNHVNSRYVAGIDGLRAIAVLSVILFHFNSGILPGGFAGVDVFFVISGYVVSGSLFREPTTSFRHFLTGFYARRILRIYPALVSCLLLIAILQTLFVPPSWLSEATDKTGTFAFFGLSNFALIWFSDGYFSPRVEFNAFTHTWSLAVEEQFYLLFPPVFFLWLAWRRRKGVAGLVANGLLPALLLASLAFSWHQTATQPDHAYYLLPSRFWELACGAMLFTLHSRNRFLACTAISKNACLIAGLVLAGLGLAFSDPKSFPFPWALLSVAGSLFVISGVAGSIERKPVLSRVVDNPLMIYIGKISYSLYLWHWPVIVLFKWTVGLGNAASVIAAVLITTAASVASYHLIEIPVRRKKFRALSLPDWQIVSRGMVAVLVCAVLTAVTFKAERHLTLSVTADRKNWYPEAWPSQTKVDTAAAPLHGRHVFVLGDSHAEAYSTMLQQLRDRQGVVIEQYGKGGCASAGLLRKAAPDCARFIGKSLDQIKAKAAPGDVVFLASLRVDRLGDLFGVPGDAAQKRQQAQRDAVMQQGAALAEAEALIATLKKLQVRIIMDAPGPVFPSPPFRCSDWFNVHNPVCEGGTAVSRTALLDHRRPTMESLGKLIERHPDIIVWDPFPVLCTGDPCSAFDKGLPIFFDGDHLSAHGNRMLYPSFSSLLDAVWKSGRTARAGSTQATGA